MTPICAVTLISLALYGVGSQGTIAYAQSEMTPVSPSSPSANTATRLEEITVTAQRREESAQDVPISMRVFSAEELQDSNARRTIDLFEATPNVNFTSVDSGVAGANIFMRGVGAMVVQNVEQGVGFYIDDMYVGSPRAFNVDLLDIDRAEILRGPQGTLYGRNALGGTIHLLSTQPQDTLAADLDTEFGNYDFRKVRASANVPLVKDTLLSRFALTYTERDGTVLNRFDGHHINDLGNLGGRAQLRFLPSQNVEIDLSGDYSRDDVSRSAFGPFADIVHQRTTLAEPADEYRDVYGAMSKLTVHHPRFTATAITGFRGVTDDIQADFTPLYPTQQGLQTRQQQVSQEFRLLSPVGTRLRWVGGLFYYREQVKNSLFVALPHEGPGGLPAGYRETSYGDVEASSYAAFADVTYPLLEKLEVTAGLRFTYDEKDLDYRHVNTLGIPGVFAPAQKAKRSAAYNNWSPRFVVSYQWTDQFLTYASVSRGYKAGAFNTVVVGGPQFKFGPETGWNYEVGVKSTLFDERLMMNLAGFYFDWHNPQVSVFNGTFFTTENASSARSFGGECEVSARPFPGGDVSVGVGYADATFVHFDNFVPGKSASGRRIPFTSKFSTNAAVQYRFLLNSWVALMLHGEMAYKSSVFYDVANTLKEPGYALVNVRVGLESERWDLFLFARNLLNEPYRTIGFYWPTGPIGAPGDPRTYGVQVRLRF